MCFLKKWAVPVLMALFFSALLSGCGQDKYEGIVISDERIAIEHPALLSELLPGYTVLNKHNGALQGLKEGAVIVTDEILAAPCMELGIAEYWYPQYLATVVIAIDRDVTEAQVHCWSDLLVVGEQIGMSDVLSETRLFLSAMSYGLEGDEYTLEKASELLASLHLRDLLKFNDYDSPILICFDYQAVHLNNAGRALEIIIPADGTFTFEKGILSSQPLFIAEDSEEILLEAGYRLPDGKSTFKAYPDDYGNAVRPSDHAYVANVFDDTTFVLKRDVQNIVSYLYSSDDGRSHQLFGLIFVILVILWTGYILKRVMQSNIRRAILVIAVLVIGWMLLRMVKYQIPLGTVNMYCWYGYYFFRLSLPLAGIWLAYAIDRPTDTIRTPKWWYACAVFHLVLFALIFTNNLHYWAFIFDPLDPSYNVHFSYGPVYYVAIILIFVELLCIQIIIIQKGWKTPRKRGFIAPFFFYVLMGLYCVGYVLRVPLIFETDSTTVNCFFTIIFIDLCIRSGLIPVNTKYKALFASSPLNIQIIDSSGDIVMRSGAATHIAGGCDAPKSPNENVLLYKSDITGGMVVWQEDIKSLNRLYQEISETNAKLKAANAILVEEERIKSQLAATEARIGLFSALEDEIHQRTLELHSKIEMLQQNDNYKSNIAIITLLLCFIKRRCILFFRERETPDIPLDEIIVYLDELSEFAAYAGIKLHVLSVMYGSLSTRQATLFYDFVYFMLEWALEQKCDTLLVQILSEEKNLVAKSMCEKDVDNLHIDTTLSQAVNAAGGIITIKDMDDVMGVWLSFPEGGDAL